MFNLVKIFIRAQITPSKCSFSLEPVDNYKDPDLVDMVVVQLIQSQL